MLKKNIIFKNFILKKKLNKNKHIINIFKKIINEKNEVLFSLDKSYKDSFANKNLNKFKNINNVTLIGMGGSILGAKAIYKFL